MAVVQSQFGGVITTASSRRAGKSSAGVEVLGLKELRSAFKLIESVQGEVAGEFEQGMWEATQYVAGEVRKRAPGSMSARVKAYRLSGKGVRARGRVEVEHPGSRPMEFGRKFYYVGYTGRNVRSGIKVLHSPGQIARPFVGIIKGDQALGASKEPAASRIAKGIERAFEKLSAAGAGSVR